MAQRRVLKACWTDVAPTWCPVPVGEMRLCPLNIEMQPTAFDHCRRRLKLEVVHNSIREV